MLGWVLLMLLQGNMVAVPAQLLLPVACSTSNPLFCVWKQVRLQVQRQLAQALFKLSVEFRKEETRFLNKIEAQKGYEKGSSIGLVEDESAGPAGTSDPGFTEMQLQKVSMTRLHCDMARGVVPFAELQCCQADAECRVFHLQCALGHAGIAQLDGVKCTHTSQFVRPVMSLPVLTVFTLVTIVGISSRSVDRGARH